MPNNIMIDSSGANTSAVESIQADLGADIELRPSRYLNNLVEQDHRAIMRIVKPILGFKSIRFARAMNAGIDSMPMMAAWLRRRPCLVRSFCVLLASLLIFGGYPAPHRSAPLLRQNSSA